MAMGAGLALARQGLMRGATALRKQMLVTLEIPSKDKSYLWFLQWMAQHQQKPVGRSILNPKAHQLAVETSYKQHDNGSVSATFSFVPGPGTHWFRYKGAWIQVTRQRDSKMMDLSTGSPWETVLLTTLFRDRPVLSELLSEAQSLAMTKQEGRTVIYTAWAADWRPFGAPRKRRILDSVILDTGVKERIVNDVNSFRKSGNWYEERGIPYRRGYLLHGPPGSGKSSFIQALAGSLEYNICVLNLSERGLSDDRLNHLLTNLPERSILLLEDVDAAFGIQRQTSTDPGYQANITFSGLLNALDGVIAPTSEERIVFMTTNHPERLDAALVRPGRVDLQAYIGDATESQILGMFDRFYGDQGESYRKEFLKNVQDRGKVSTAALQGHFVQWKDDPAGATSNVDTIPAKSVQHRLSDP